MAVLNFHTLVCITLGTLLLGCTTHRTNTDQEWIEQTVHARYGNRLNWPNAPDHSTLFSQEFTAEDAVKFAVLNNPSLLASFEEIGISQAELWQAALPSNPLLGFERFSVSPGSGIKTGLSFAWDFLDFLQIPLRKRLAESQLLQTRLKVADNVLSLTSQVKSAYLELQASKIELELQKQIFFLAEAWMEMAQKQKEAGNIGQRQLSELLTISYEAKLNILRAEQAATLHKEKLIRLLGIAHSPIDLKIPLKQRVSLLKELNLEVLEKTALDHRLDLSVAKERVNYLVQLGLSKRWWSYTDAAIVLSLEKETDASRSRGIGTKLKLPFFDHGQAARAHTLAQMRQSQHQLAALELEIRSQVREAAKQIFLLEKLLTTYQKQILPTYEDLINASQEEYNAMAIGAYELLRNKQKELEARIQYTHILSEYEMACTKLDLVLGTRWQRKGILQLEHEVPIKQEIELHHHHH